MTISIERHFGVECIIEEGRYQVTLDVQGKGFEGRSRDEVLRLLQRWLRPAARQIERLKISASAKQFDADALRFALRNVELPKQPIKVTSKHHYPSQCRKESYFVRRSVGHNCKIYFGTYHTKKRAQQASLLLCLIINEEIEKRRGFLSVTRNFGGAYLLNDPPARMV